jgi:hypothetical protein
MSIVIEDPATLNALRDKSCLLAGDVIDRGAIIQLVVDELEANHVAHSLDEVTDVAVTAGQLAENIFGVDDLGLTKLIGGLLSTGVAGKVQAALADGSALCATRGKITVELPGGEQRAFSVAGRFVSDDPDTLAAYLLGPVAKRASAVASRASDLGEMVKERRPEMAERVDAWSADLELTFRGALSAGSIQ